MERCTKRTELPYSFCAHSCTNTLHPWGPNLHGIHFNTKSSFTESQKTEEKNQDRCTKIQGAQERTGGKIQSYWRYERRCYESKGKWKTFCNLCVILYSLSFSIKIVLTFIIFTAKNAEKGRGEKTPANGSGEATAICLPSDNWWRLRVQTVYPVISFLQSENLHTNLLLLFLLLWYYVS